MGGGTTIVEAIASGRYAAGTDVNELSRFIARAKTTPLSLTDLAEIRDWVNAVKSIAVSGSYVTSLDETPIRHLPPLLYPFFEIAIHLVSGLRFPRRRGFAQCALTSVGQWALDGRANTPSPREISEELGNRVERMIAGLDQLVSRAKEAGIWKHKITSHRRLLARSAADPRLANILVRKNGRPKLILTSPPYPGVHVLYHRWQVFGRRETPAPYWIANLRDGRSEAHYTMGGRSALGLRNYFGQLLSAFSNLRRIVADDATIVQLVAFSDADRQLPKYMDTMSAAGFVEKQMDGDLARPRPLSPKPKSGTTGTVRTMMLVERCCCFMSLSCRCR